MASAERPPEGVVLVVEDHEAVRRITVRILTEAGFRVVEARDGAEALGLLAELGPRVVWLVVSDIVMPQTTGDELAETIAAEWPSVQVLLLSAQTGPLGGFTGAFLQKPFTPEGLLAAVRALQPTHEASVD
ncbi:MAG TPA: response regulator [Gemmatimonadales bacterium]|nr:response regulator [Gemmatimonadales bacterium]